jgi:hypothetical protein
LVYKLVVLESLLRMPVASFICSDKLSGKNIALTGARRFQELEMLVQKMGGRALLRPMAKSAHLKDA